MNIAGNTILITGGGSGIGLGLAEALKTAGNEIIVAGRSASKLEHAAKKGLRTLEVDMTDLQSIRDFAGRALREFRRLNFVIHNAGIMVNEKLTSRDNSETAAETIATNLLGPIQLTNALLPHFLKQPSAVIMTMTSGLAYVPLAMTPTYCATKAAIHSYTQSLRYQLKDTKVEVKELVPPYVRTALMGERQAQDGNAMPLEEFVTEAIGLMRDNPEAEQITVQRVLPQRTAGYDAPKYEEFFRKQNDLLMTARKTEWDQL